MKAQHRGTALARAGFTLVELLVAITVAGAVTLIAHGAVATGLDTIDRARAHLDAVQRRVAVRQQLFEWLRSSQIKEVYGDTQSAHGFAGYDRVDAGVADDSLVFVTVTQGSLGRERVLIALALDNDPATPDSGLVAEVRSLQTGRVVDRLALVPQATSFDARYLFRLGGEPRWFSGWQSSVEPPAAVELRINAPGLSPLISEPILVVLEQAE